MSWIRGRQVPLAYVLAFVMVLAGSAGYVAYDYSGKRSICDAQGQLDVEYAFTFDPEDDTDFFVFEQPNSGAVYEVRTMYSPPLELLERDMIWSQVPSESYLELQVDDGHWRIYPGEDRAEYIPIGTTNVAKSTDIRDCAGSDVLEY